MKKKINRNTMMFVTMLAVLCAAFAVTSVNADKAPTADNGKTTVATAVMETPFETNLEIVPFTAADIAKSDLVIHGKGFDLVPMTMEKWQSVKSTTKLVDSKILLADNDTIGKTRGAILTKHEGKPQFTAITKTDKSRSWHPADVSEGNPKLFYIAIHTEKDKEHKEKNAERGTPKGNPQAKLDMKR